VVKNNGGKPSAIIGTTQCTNCNIYAQFVRIRYHAKKYQDLPPISNQRAPIEATIAAVPNLSGGSDKKEAKSYKTISQNGKAPNSQVPKMSFLFEMRYTKTSC